MSTVQMDLSTEPGLLRLTEKVVFRYKTMKKIKRESTLQSLNS